MINTLIERDLWSMERRKEAMEQINPLLNKLTDSVITCEIADINDKIGVETIIRKYIEVDVWDWCAMIVLNVLPQENKELFDAFKKVFAEYGVKEYKKENDADTKKRKLRAKFNLFQYKSYKNDYEHDYNVDIVFRGDLPESCVLEYEEYYEEIESDDIILKNGKLMKKQVNVSVICEDTSVLRLPQATA